LLLFDARQIATEFGRIDYKKVRKDRYRPQTACPRHGEQAQVAPFQFT
jgi:hypothetical protein